MSSFAFFWSRPVREMCNAAVDVDMDDLVVIDDDPDAAWARQRRYVGLLRALAGFGAATDDAEVAHAVAAVVCVQRAVRRHAARRHAERRAARRWIGLVWQLIGVADCALQLDAARCIQLRAREWRARSGGGPAPPPRRRGRQRQKGKKPRPVGGTLSRTQN